MGCSPFHGRMTVNAFFQVVVSDCGGDLDVGQVLVKPQASYPMQGYIVGEGRRYPAEYGLLHFFGKCAFELQIQQEMVAGIGNGDASEPCILSGNNGTEQKNRDGKCGQQFPGGCGNHRVEFIDGWLAIRRSGFEESIEALIFKHIQNLFNLQRFLEGRGEDRFDGVRHVFPTALYVRRMLQGRRD